MLTAVPVEGRRTQPLTICLGRHGGTATVEDWVVPQSEASETPRSHSLHDRHYRAHHFPRRFRHEGGRENR